MALAATLLLRPHSSLTVCFVLQTNSTGRSSSSSHLHLAKRLAKRGRLLEMMSLVQERTEEGVLVDAESFLRSSVGAQLVRGGCVSAIEIGKLPCVLEFCKQLQALGIPAANYLGREALELIVSECTQLLHAKKPEDCIDILETLATCRFAVKSLVKPSLCIQACVQTRNVPLALRYARLLPNLVLTCNIIMQEFRDCDDLHSVFDIFSSLKDLGAAPDMYTYSTLIDACGRCGERKLATAVFEELSKSRFVDNVYVHNSYMNVLAKDLSEVLRLFREMQCAGVQPDLASYNIVLKACSLSKVPQLAANMYRELRTRKAAGLMELSVFTYSTMIQIFGDAKWPLLAFKVKEDMTADGVVPNVVTWTSLVGACSSAGFLEKAFHVYQEMLDSGCAPNSHTYNLLLGACVQAGQNERALRIFNEWKETGRVRPPNGASTVSSIRPNVLAYNIMLKASDGPEQAEFVMREILSSGYKPDIRSWSILIDIYGTRGDEQGAVEALARMERSGVLPDVVTFTAVIKACLNARQFGNAFTYLDRLKQAGISPNQVTYKTLLRAERGGNMQNIQACLRVYTEMRNAGFPPDEPELKKLIEEWAEGIMNSRSSYEDDNVASQIFKEYGDLLLRKLVPEQSENYVIDVQALSKVEVRAALLAVLRLIRDRYSEQRPVQEDLVIITGPKPAEGPAIEDVVTEVLQRQLFIQVSNTDYADEAVTMRKPVSIGKLMVSRHTLNDWIQKKSRK